ncbi:MAG: hypothetical protein ABUL71_03800 [Gemmatimonadota bacterium]
MVPAPIRRCTAACAASLFLACGHGEAFVTSATTSGPSSAGPDVRLTYNAEQDYWPTWTEDGQGILYSFVHPDTAAQHRCIGLLPKAGGATTWQLCDDRAIQRDSVNSFPAYALGNDGRLLYVEAVARRGVGATTPAHTTLWLADTATPFQRQQLLSLPTTVTGTAVAWLADITWTGPTSFVALGQDFVPIGHCQFCAATDSTFPGVIVLRGSIVAGGLALTTVSGTAGASSYSLAEGGTSIAFTMRDDRRLYKVPLSGGAPVAVATVSLSGNAQLLGVSCKGTTCVVASDPVTLTNVNGNGIIFPSVGTGATELRAVSLASGVVQVLRTTAGIVATPQISPITGDVVAQVGGLFGRLQTVTSAASDLHLYLGLLP